MFASCRQTMKIKSFTLSCCRDACILNTVSQIGFSIHGPGCAAPARFISMLHYSAWIHETLRDNDDEEDYDYMSPNYRRTNSLDTEYIPIHRTFTWVICTLFPSYWWFHFHIPTKDQDSATLLFSTILTKKSCDIYLKKLSWSRNKHFQLSVSDRMIQTMTRELTHMYLLCNN